jgi:quinol-cytochrome oxidoreductase complex cytochrome b subunit
MIFKEFKVYIAMGVGVLTGYILAHWFAKSENREPTKYERNYVLAIYGVLIGCIFALQLLTASKVTSGGVITVAIIAIAYPGFMSFAFKEKLIGEIITKKSLKDHSNKR